MVDSLQTMNFGTLCNSWSEMRKIERVCVVGAGVIGSLFIGHLGTIIETTVLTRRENHSKDLNENGLRVSGKSELHAEVKASTDPSTAHYFFSI